MALIVGNLLTDPSAQSFISLDDADVYLGIENIEAWQLAVTSAKEAALVRASRWLVATFRFGALDDVGLARVGRVAARLAAESLTVPLFAGTDTTALVTSVKVGPISESYAGPMKADAAGMSWPWLRPMLSGLITTPEGRGWALVV